MPAENVYTYPFFLLFRVSIQLLKELNEEDVVNNELSYHVKKAISPIVKRSIVKEMGLKCLSN